jgi:hypothetical protein
MTPLLSKGMARNPSRQGRAVTATEPEWAPYRCRIPAQREQGFNRTVCCTLTEVYHVAHVPDACRIIEDGRIKAGLIGDESPLKKTRTSVSWLSANSWSWGSIYGNVQFSFRWDDIIEGKQIYWVEAMHYRPHAYRFLITERNLSSSSLVKTYDPESARGPLRPRDGTWYWNDQYTSECCTSRCSSTMTIGMRAWMAPRILPCIAASTRFVSLARRSCRRCQNAMRSSTDADLGTEPKLAICSWQTLPSIRRVSTRLT